MNNDEKYCAIYVRVSTDDQTEYSPDSQVKLCRKYAKEHNIEIIEECIYREEGISGTTADKRPQFQKMIATAKSKKCPFNTILVYDFSRFARNKEESVMYKTLLRKKLKIDIISITQPLSSGKESVILESMYEAMDEYYSLNLSENTLRGKIEKASRGEHQGNPPYGYIYNKNTKMIEIDPSKAKIVRIIFEDWNNNMSIRQIVRKLNSMEIKTARGYMFVDRNIHIILNNPAYIGKTRFTVGGMGRDWHNPNTKIVDGKHEPIISESTWNKAQEKLVEHNDLWFKYKKPQGKNEHWLRGIVKCGDCGCSLVKNKSYGRSKAHFQCTGYGKSKCNRSHFIREEILVQKILEQIKLDYSEKLDINISYKTITDNNYDIEYIQEELKKIDNKMIRIKNAYINEIDTLEEYKENKNKLENSRLKLNKQLEELNSEEKIKDKIKYTYAKCEEAYKILSDTTTSNEIKYDIAHKLFDKIIYDKDNEELLVYYK